MNIIKNCVSAISLAAVVFGASAASAADCDAPEKKWSLGYVIVPNPDHPTHAAGLAFKEAVQEKSGCRIQVDLYPGAQLGGDREMFEAISIGTQDFGFISSMPVGSFTAAVDALNLPWLFQGDLALLNEVVYGEAGKLMFDGVVADTGVRPLGIATTPFRHFISSKPVAEIDDVTGLKVRVMQSNLSVAAFQSIGANPTPMAFSEVYGALQTGVVDALENDVIGMYAEKLYEVAKHVTWSGHFNNPLLIVVNDSLFEGLSDEDRTIAREAARIASDVALATTEAQVGNSVEKLKALGVTFYEMDNTPFREAMGLVYADIEAKSDITKKVVEMVTEIRDNR